MRLKMPQHAAGGCTSAHTAENRGVCVSFTRVGIVATVGEMLLQQLTTEGVASESCRHQLPSGHLM